MRLDKKIECNPNLSEVPDDDVYMEPPCAIDGSHDTSMTHASLVSRPQPTSLNASQLLRYTLNAPTLAGKGAQDADWPIRMTQPDINARSDSNS